MPASRQLAAIMFTDIVGYTALMGRDEKLAFTLLEQNREIQQPIINAHNGTLIKELGDGIMASFTTVSDAVYAAMKIQEQCRASASFQLRIGIHVGEVVFENDDVFGDGVNIASRIQSIAPPGGIYVSEAVHNNIANKKDVSSSFVKEAILKNVSEPVRIYEIISDGRPLRRIRKMQSRKINRFAWLIPMILIVAAGLWFLLKGSAAKAAAFNPRSIAILPFTDLSPAKDQEYLGNGLAEEISNSITIINGLKVIAPNSALPFKGKNMSSQEIGKKLNVATVLEGSIQKYGDSLRIITKLIDVNDNSTVWSQGFDKRMQDIFAIQDTIASNIVDKLKITLSDSERPRLIKKETNQEVYSYYLKGLYTYKQTAFEESIDYNTKALAIDSNFAPSYAYIALAKTWIIYSKRAYADAGAIREAKQYAERAIRIDPDLAEGYSALALLAWAVELDFPVAENNFEKSVSLNPSASLVRNRYGYFLLWMGQFEKAIEMGREAMNADPADYNSYAVLTSANMYLKKYKEAEKYMTEGKKLFPDLKVWQYLQLRIDFLAGRYDNVIKSSKEGDDPEQLSLTSASYYYKKDIPASQRIMAQMREKRASGLPDVNYFLARLYALYGEKDSSFQALNISFNQREPDFKTFKIDPMFESLHDDPRYKDLYHRYGFDRYP